MQHRLPLQNGHPGSVGEGEKKRKGRPPGSTNKRSPDLAKYLAAMGGTPGQQMAQLSMVTPAQIGRAKREAVELGLTVAGLDPLQVAEVVQAERLALALGVTRAEAYAARHRARAELMPYVHQKMPAASDPKDKAPVATVFMVPEGEAAQSLPSFDDEDEGLEILEDLREPVALVGRGQSDGEA